MARDWERWLQNSCGPASEDEETKRDRTEKRIKDAIDDSDLAAHVRVYAKGSYANSTNVRLDSDVDICVEWNDTFAVERFGPAKGASAAALGYTPAAKDFDPVLFRASVLRAMKRAFGSAVDDTGNKAINIAAGSRTLDADVVPCREMRRYDSVGATPHIGSRIHPKRGGYIDNWPQQQYDNGVTKNRQTGRRYKSIIRCLKRLENEMLEDSVISRPVPGYLIECVVWQAPNSCFGHPTLLADLRSVFRSVWSPLKSDGECSEWGEVNELKYLFRSGQAWTRQQAFEFIDKAWDTVGVS